MMEHAEDVAMQVMARTQELGGAVSGEHGIGITKISFLDPKQMENLREFKMRVDPRDLFNPGKLVTRNLPVRPFTFSFNRLIADIRESGLPDKECLIRLLSQVQTCTRCGKCKQVCPMVYPERSFQYNPRNKNIILGALTEAILLFAGHHGASFAGTARRTAPSRGALHGLRPLHLGVPGEDRIVGSGAELPGLREARGTGRASHQVAGAQRALFRSFGPRARLCQNGGPRSERDESVPVKKEEKTVERCVLFRQRARVSAW